MQGIETDETDRGRDFYSARAAAEGRTDGGPSPVARLLLTAGGIFHSDWHLYYVLYE